MFSQTSEESPVYDRLVKLVFSGEISPGTKLVERDLARELGVSRIPVRESLAKMVAQGLLIGGEKWQGARVRAYNSEEIRQLYEYREMLEGGIARAAARNRSSSDIERLGLICDESQKEIGNYGSQRWAQLDHRFHFALAEACRNERMLHSTQLLLTECFYVFYLYPAQQGRPAPSHDDVIHHMESIVADHRELVALIEARDSDGAEQKARLDMRKSGRRATRALIDKDLER
jgi:DNA-binding GntR family transcriptional regulator